MTERERFEAWFMSEYTSANNELRMVDNSALLTEIGRDYVNLGVNRMWVAWQAAKRDADAQRS